MTMHPDSKPRTFERKKIGLGTHKKGVNGQAGFWFNNRGPAAGP